MTTIVHNSKITSCFSIGNSLISSSTINNESTESTALGSVATASCPRVSCPLSSSSCERALLMMMLRRVRWSGRVCPVDRVATGRMESTAVGGHSRRRPPAVPGGGDGKLRDKGDGGGGRKLPTAADSGTRPTGIARTPRAFARERAAFFTARQGLPWVF